MSKRGFVDWRAYSAQTKESAYGAGAAIDSTWNMDPNPTQQMLNNRFINNEEVTGLEEASETQELSRSAEHPHAQRAQSHAIAFFGAAAWGSHTTTEVASLAAGRVYRHDIILTTAPGVLPSFSWVENRHDIVRHFPGGVVGRFAISGERNAHIRQEADVVGAGTFVDVSTVRPALLTADPFLRASEAKVFFGTGTIGSSTPTQSTTVSDVSGSPAELDCLLDAFGYEVNNNLLADTEAYGFGTGTSRCQLERDQRQQSLSMTVQADGLSTELDRLMAQTNLAAEIDVVSGVEVVAGSGFFYGFNLLFPRLRYEAVNLGGGRGRQIWEITANPLEQANSSNELRPAMLSVWNATSGYLG